MYWPTSTQKGRSKLLRWLWHDVTRSCSCVGILLSIRSRNGVAKIRFWVRMRTVCRHPPAFRRLRLLKRLFANSFVNLIRLTEEITKTFLIEGFYIWVSFYFLYFNININSKESKRDLITRSLYSKFMIQDSRFPYGACRANSPHVPPLQRTSNYQ